MRKGQKLPKQRMSIEQSAQKVIDLLAHAPSGYEYSAGAKNLTSAAMAGALGTFSIRWTRPGWGISASISIRWHGDGDGEHYLPVVKVTWGSASYSPAQAVAASKLNADVAMFACLLKAMFADQPAIITGSTEDLPPADADVAIKSTY